MKLVVELGDNTIAMCKWHRDKICDLAKPEIDIVAEAIANGIPLPKGHGRLIDANEVKERLTDAKDGYARHVIDSTPTIIEADKDGD